jgi:hypothetical protein
VTPVIDATALTIPVGRAELQLNRLSWAIGRYAIGPRKPQWMMPILDCSSSQDLDLMACN